MIANEITFLNILQVGAVLVVFYAVVWAITPIAFRIGLVDHPDQTRKHHKESTALVGGIAIYSVLAGTSLIVSPPPTVSTLLFGSAIILGLGILDDWKGVSVGLRLIVQFMTALFIFGYSDTGLTNLILIQLNPDEQILGWVLAAIAATALMNSFNLIDGVNGLSSGLILVGLGIICAEMFILKGHIIHGDWLATFALIVLAFWFINMSLTPLRVIFLGDSGSTLLGLIYAWILIYYTQTPVSQLNTATATWAVTLAVFDTLTVILIRLGKRKSPFSGGREHLHYALVDFGFSTKQTLCIIISLAIILGLLGATTAHLFGAKMSLLILFATFIVYYRLNCTIQTRESHGEPQKFKTKNDTDDYIMNDLLGRSINLPLNELLVKNIKDQNILVTGAGGTIGAELVKQAAQIGARKIVLVDHSEFSLYEIHEALLNLIPDDSTVEVIPILASILDYQHMDSIFLEWKPHSIFHSAAYKHVPIVENNPISGIRTNVIGTFNIFKLAMQHDCRSCTLISTDKAVEPTCLMGLTKNAAEKIFGVANQIQTTTIYSSVRFGNVFGSSGSVVQKFLSQIENRKPITITDPEMTRYFMTSKEAAQLVIQASAIAKNGIFILEMGKPIKIYDLAIKLIQQSELTLKTEDNLTGDVEIKITGIRPGEKLHEKLTDDGKKLPTCHPRIYQLTDPSHELNYDQLSHLIKRLEASLASLDVKIAIEILEVLTKRTISNPPNSN